MFFLYNHFRPHLTQVQDAAGQKLPCLPCQGVEGGETRARQPGERILSDQGSQTEVHLIILCPDSAGHPSRDGVLLIVGVQVFRLGLFIYPSLTPGGHNQSILRVAEIDIPHL